MASVHIALLTSHFKIATHILTIKSEQAGSCLVNLMMWPTIKDYHRRGLSYWFHIICNSFCLLSRSFSSPLCFVWLCPFLIIVTDRRSAEKDAENEEESGDFVLPYMCVCECLQMGGCGCRYLSYRSGPLPMPLPSLLLFIVRDVLSPKYSQHQLVWYRTITTTIQV